MPKSKIKHYKYRKNIVLKLYKLLFELNKVGELKILNYKIIQLSKKLELLLFIENKKINIKKINNKFLIEFLEKIINKNNLHLLSYVIYNYKV
jgi:hypothetical protein